MSWKRILERSNAFEASDKSIAASIVYNGGVEMTEQVAVRNEICFGCSRVNGLINSYIYSNFPKSNESMASCHPSSDSSGKGDPSFIEQELELPSGRFQATSVAFEAHSIIAVHTTKIINKTLDFWLLSPAPPSTHLDTTSQSLSQLYMFCVP